jgi:hypothetical protein
MWYDRYDEDDLANHHPTCKGGCNQLADECMCNYDFERGMWKSQIAWSSQIVYDSDVVLSVVRHDEALED